MFSTFELYDEDEYFLKFLLIHRSLHYVSFENDNISYNKMLYQEKLLTDYKNKIITKDELQNEYKIYLEYVREVKNNYYQLEYELQQQLINQKNIDNKNIIEYLESKLEN